MNNLQAPAPRNRRSARHAAPQNTAGAAAQQPVRQQRAQRPARPAHPRTGRFPVRTCIVLGMVLIICILALGIARGKLNRLRTERENAAAEYQQLVERHTVAYREDIEKYATQNDIHPAYVAAIILRESSYDPSATSSVGARGLMQIMEDTFEFVRKKLGEDGTTFADMYDPTTNIRYGCWYLGYLSRMFNGDPIQIACAYHAGPNNVKLWTMNRTADGRTLTLEDIPYDNTRYYAGKVVNAYDIYYQHYYPDAQ